MRFYRKMAAYLVCATLVFGVCASAGAVEMKLAGIKLGRPSSDVLKKFGNPTRVTVGSVAVGTMGGSQPSGPVAPAPVSGSTSMYGALGPLGGALSSYGSALNTASNEALPGMPGLSMPGYPGMQGGTGQPSQPAQNQIMEQETTWTFDLPKGITAEFIISETGQVVQITVGGDKLYADSKTTKGIKLGSVYKDVLLKYGYPEGQQYIGRFLRVSYKDRHRVIFTMLSNKVVGVTIALKDTDE